MKTFRWLILAAVLAAAAVGGYTLYQRLTPSPQKAGAEETAVVQRGNLTLTAAAFGSISLPSKAKLSFPTAGTLTEMGVAVGDQVSQGQVLARLDDGPLRQAVLQAQTALKNAELALKKTRELYPQEDIARQEAAVAEAQRGLELSRRDLAIVRITGENSVADAREAVKKAKAAVADAQRALELARLDISATRTSGEKSVADAQQALDTAQAPYSEDDIATAKDNVAQAQRALELARRDLTIVRTTGENSVADAQRALYVARQEVILVRTSGEKTVADAQRTLDEDVTSARSVLERYTGRGYTSQEILETASGQLFLSLNPPRSAEEIYRALTKVKDSREKLDVARLQADKSLQAAQSAVSKAEEPLRQAQVNLTEVEAGQGVGLAQLQAEKSLQAAQNAVANAEAALRQAQARLADMTPDPQEVQKAQRNLELGQLQAEKSVQAAQSAVSKAEETLRQAQVNLAEVEAGQGVELAKLQTDKSLQAAQGAVSKAEETLRQAQAQLAEMKEGADRDEIAVKELQVSQARLSLEEAEANLKAARLVAPFAGAVAEVGAELGGRVSAGAPVVVLVDPSRAEVSATVDEVDVARVRVGQPVAITLDALPGERLQGQVKSISPVAQIQSGVVSYPVVISLASGDGVPREGMAPRQGMTRGGGGTGLPPAAPSSAAAQVQPRQGMSASAEIVVEMKRDVLLVPSRAVRSMAPGTMISVKTAQGVELRLVEVGGTDGRNTEIVSGLQEGETVVLPAASGSTSPTRPLGGSLGGGGMRMFP